MLPVTIPPALAPCVALASWNLCYPDGRLGAATDIKKDVGEIGPTRAASAPPGSFAFSGHDRTHAHMIQADPSGRFVLHVDR